MKFCRYFDRFAASLVCCLSEARQGKLADKRPVKMTCINFLVWILYPIISFFSYTIYTTTFKLPPIIRLILKSNIPSLKYRILPIFLLLLIIRKCLKRRIRQDQDHRNINECHHSHQHI